MSLPHCLSRFFTPLLLVISVFMLGGCSDTLLSSESPVTEPAQTKESANYGRALADRIVSRTSKARHLHLLDRAMLPAAASERGFNAGKAAASDSVRLVMGFSDDAEPADSVLNKVASGFKIFNRYTYTSSIRGSAVTVAEEDLETFSSNADTVSDVQWFEPDPDDAVESETSTTATSTGQKISWSMGDIGADSSWTVSGDAQGAVTGVDLYVVDTGANHSDLQVSKCLELSKGSLATCSDPSDPSGHGTQVAGVAGAVDDTAGAVGVAPGINIYAVQALNKGGRIVLGRLLAVVDYVTQQKKENPSKPIVVNMSLGSNVNATTYNGLDQAIQASIAAGVVYVFAAGNSGIDAETITPAHVSEGITVGSYNEDRQFSGFSNYGSLIDILAPGENVLTLNPDGGIGEVSGTSVAAPHVAGAAALLLAQDPSLTPAQVRDQLVSSSSAGISALPAGTTDRSLYVGP